MFPGTLASESGINRCGDSRLCDEMCWHAVRCTQPGWWWWQDDDGIYPIKNTKWYKLGFCLSDKKYINYKKKKKMSWTERSTPPLFCTKRKKRAIYSCLSIVQSAVCHCCVSIQELKLKLQLSKSFVWKNRTA